MSAASEPLPAALAALVPAKLQKITASRDGEVIVEIFAAGKQWLRLRPGALTPLAERPTRDGDDVDETTRGLLRKELLPGILSAIDIDEVRGLWRLTIHRPGAHPRVLVIERDRREPRWLLLAPVDQGERILGVMPATKPGDGRDTRRGRLYEPPRRAPVAPDEAGESAAMAPTTSVPTTSPALQQARQRLKAEHERLKRLHKKLEGDLARHGDPERTALDGELLKSVMGRLPRGADHVVVVDVDGAERRIVLDPARDAKGNLQRLFDRARRARAAITHARPRIDDVTRRIMRVATLRERLVGVIADDEVEVLRDVDALLAAPESGPSARRKAALAGRRQAWRCFVVDGDVVVRVGRGAKDNDALVKSARGHDLWMHARDRTGAHVIIPSTGGPIPDAAFVDAAHLAAWFSAARGERHVDIQHTRVKHLKKPGAGAPAGLFIVGNEAVSHLRVDDERTKTLLSQEVAAG
jgi:hypothetical protein